MTVEREFPHKNLKMMAISAGKLPWGNNVPKETFKSSSVSLGDVFDFCRGMIPNARTNFKHLQNHQILFWLELWLPKGTGQVVPQICHCCGRLTVHGGLPLHEVHVLNWLSLNKDQGNHFVAKKTSIGTPSPALSPCFHEV